MPDKYEWPTVPGRYTLHNARGPLPASFVLEPTGMWVPISDDIPQHRLPQYVLQSDGWQGALVGAQPAPVFFKGGRAVGKSTTFAAVLPRYADGPVVAPTQTTELDMTQESEEKLADGPNFILTRYDAVEEQLLALVEKHAKTYPGLSLSRSYGAQSATAQLTWGVSGTHAAAAATARVADHGGDMRLAAQAALAGLLERARVSLTNPPRRRQRVFRAVLEITADNESVNGGADGFGPAAPTVDDVHRFLSGACSELELDLVNNHDPVGVTAIEIDWDTLTEIPTDAPLAPNGAAPCDQMQLEALARTAQSDAQRGRLLRRIAELLDQYAANHHRLRFDADISRVEAGFRLMAGTPACPQTVATGYVAGRPRDPSLYALDQALANLADEAEHALAGG